MDIVLKNGSFYKAGIKVPLEFGNKEQIKLIEAVKQLKEEGALPAFILDDTGDRLIGLSLQCVCGSKVQCTWEDIEDGGGESLIGEKLKCRGCDFTYVICEDEYGFKYFKIAEEKKRKGVARG